MFTVLFLMPLPGFKGYCKLYYPEVKKSQQLYGAPFNLRVLHAKNFPMYESFGRINIRNFVESVGGVRRLEGK